MKGRQPDSLRTRSRGQAGILVDGGETAAWDEREESEPPAGSRLLSLPLRASVPGRTAPPRSSAAGVWALLGDALAFRCRRDRELAADPSTRLERLGELDRRLEDQIRREELVLFARIEQALPEAVPTAFRAAVVQAGGRDLTEQLGVCRGTRRRRPTGTLAPERM